MSEPATADVAIWCARPRDAMRSDSDVDLRTIVLFIVAQKLATVDPTPEQTRARQRLDRVAVALAGLRGNDLRWPYVLGDLAKAWMAFERAWENTRPTTS